MGLLQGCREDAVSEVVARTSLSGDQKAAGAARRFLRDALARWEAAGLPAGVRFGDRLLDDGTLLVSELVTNAVVHAGTDVELECRLEALPAPPGVVIEVGDRHPARVLRDDTQEPADTREGGRGLHLVAALSDAWGISYRRDRKTVWCRLDLAPAEDPADARDGAAAPPADLLAPVPPPAPPRGDQDWTGGAALTFLAGTSDLLAGRLDEPGVAALATQLLVPRIADWCALWTYARGSAPRLAAVWHAEEQHLDALRSALTPCPPPPAPTPIARPWPYPDATAALSRPRTPGAGDRDEGGGRGSDRPEGPAAGSAGGSDADPGRDEGGGRGSDRPEGLAADPVAAQGADPRGDLAVDPDRVSDQAPESGVGPSVDLDRVAGPRVGEAAEPDSDQGANPGVDPGAGVGSGADQAPDSGVGSGGGAGQAPGRGVGSGAGSGAALGRFIGGGAFAVPLVVGGRCLGTLLVGRVAGPVMGDGLTGLVEDFARRVALALGTARQYARQAALAAVLHRGLVPAAAGAVPGIDHAVVREPPAGGRVGGDSCGLLYDLFPAGDGRWCFALGGVYGDGPEGAPLAGLVRPVLRLLAREGLGVPGVLGRLDEALAAETPTPDSGRAPGLALLYGEITPYVPGRGARCTLASAGHPAPLLLSGTSGLVTAAATAQPPLGTADPARYAGESFDLRPGDTLLCATGGAASRHRPDDDGGGDGGLAALLRGCTGLPAADIARRVLHAAPAPANAPAQAPPGGDLAVLVLRAR
ncbi:SpoIIE family protein phosphatase [Actinacidiphila epipremni]|uniref:SpoIIE family protein phosphatase n=1 Tax=Actinacidiphila epipremni TaxID=2053013 RepID=A0ABX0ZEC0_9ACTN|nr:ATP-binding SpoIIE family protein phosphatase [Actinacidiphila epipremni]NJP42123.1 SpoIIE family protein phosphatase [Actinacidiphila epipremni]